MGLFSKKQAVKKQTSNETVVREAIYALKEYNKSKNYPSKCTNYVELSSEDKKVNIKCLVNNLIVGDKVVSYYSFIEITGDDTNIKIPFVRDEVPYKKPKVTKKPSTAKAKSKAVNVNTLGVADDDIKRMLS